jgi:hypothetical protein
MGLTIRRATTDRDGSITSMPRDPAAAGASASYRPGLRRVYDPWFIMPSVFSGVPCLASASPAPLEQLVVVLQRAATASDLARGLAGSC